MLETIRDFALERLVASGDHVSALDHHARYYMSLAERTDWCWNVSLPEGETLLAHLHAEEANLRAALQWLDQRPDPAALLHLAASLGALWVVSGHTREGQHWLERALADESTTSPSLRAKGLATLSWIMNVQQQAAVALELAAEALTLCNDQSHADWITMVLCRLLSGTAAYNLASFDLAVVHLKEGLALLSGREASERPSRPDVRPALIVTFSAHLGQVALMQGDLADAEAWFRSALALQLDLGGPSGQSQFMGMWCLLDWATWHVPRAIPQPH